MFKKSRRKIVAALVCVLSLLFFGTLAVIYAASYVQVTNGNRKMLEQYVEEYRPVNLPQLRTPAGGENESARGGENESAGDGESESAVERENESVRGGEIAGSMENPPENVPRGRRMAPPMAELSTFYTVVLSSEQEVLAVDTGGVSGLEEDALADLAREIAVRGQEKGTRNRLIYQMADKGEYVLVAFLDNTVMAGTTGTLINYTLLFGGVVLVLLFALSWYLAGRIVRPLEESYEKQKQFVSDAGHELKTPVAVMGVNIELLAREMGENQWISNIQYENERMSALISQLLELARAENEKPVTETVDFGRLVNEETLPLETVAYERGLILNSEVAGEVRVCGNSVQLRQLISILIDNAIRHGEGGKEIWITLKKEKNHALLSVANEGAEIPPEQRKHLFERFYRADSARTGEERHYGLGLAIAKAIVTSHQGSIELQCHDGKVEFVVKLPLRKP